MPMYPRYQKWHQTICHPSYFTPSCWESDENKPCKYNEASILWLLVGIWLHLISRKWGETIKMKPQACWCSLYLLRCLVVVVVSCCGRQSCPVGWLWWGLTLGCRGKRLVRSIKKGKLDPCSADWCGQLGWHVSETGCIAGVLGTWNQRQGNRGGNSERVTGGSGNRGVWGWWRVRERVLHCTVSSCALPLTHSWCPKSFKWPSSLLRLEEGGQGSKRSRKAEIRGCRRGKCAVQLWFRCCSITVKPIHAHWNPSSWGRVLGTWVITFFPLSV